MQTTLSTAGDPIQAAASPAQSNCGRSGVVPLHTARRCYDTRGAPDDSRTLSASQAGRLKESLGPQLRYPSRLLNRMEKIGFLSGDPLYERVKKKYDATHDLHVHLHYLGCKASRRATK